VLPAKEMDRRLIIGSMRDVRKISAPPNGSISVRLLLAANVILIGAAWVLSVYGYRRLPPEIPSWLSLWTGGRPPVERSLGYFLYPVCQVVFFLALSGLAKISFLRTPKAGGDDRSSTMRKARRVQILKKEVVSLALIFVNLIFIHLQTSLTLLSHRIVTGFNKSYLLAIGIMIVFILGPYYRIRRKIILTEPE
jgi:hypothetical protein